MKNINPFYEKYRKLSLASLVTGILSIASGFIFSIFDNLFNQSVLYFYIVEMVSRPLVGFAFSVSAIICGSIDLRKIKSGLHSTKGKGFDIAGIVLGIINFLLLPILLLFLWLSFLTFQ